MSDKKQPCVVVCVTPQESCARLIEAGARIAEQEGLPLVVLSVFRESNGLNANENNVLLDFCMADKSVVEDYSAV